jgi:hypothetical protein
MSTTDAAVNASNALTTWAKGDHGMETAVEITLDSIIRRYFIDHTGAATSWVQWSPTRHSARPRWADLLAAGGQSSGERFLLALCENIAHGPEDSPNLNLGGLWNLDQGNAGAVLDALNRHLRR